MLAQKSIKANSVERWPMLKISGIARIDLRHMNMIKDIYENASEQIKLNEETKPNPVKLPHEVELHLEMD